MESKSFGVSRNINTIMLFDKYIYNKKYLILRWEIYHSAKILPINLKSPIKPKDHPDTIDDRPQTAITPGICEAINAT